MSETNIKAGDVAKSVGRAAAKTGRGVGRATVWTATNWRGMLPVLCAGGALVFAGGSLLFAALYGPLAWVWIALTGALIFLLVDAQIGKLDRRAQPPAIALLYYALASALAVILAGTVLEVYFALLLAMLGLGIWWWSGDAYRRHKKVERAKRKMRAVLGKLGVSDNTRVTSTSIAADGSTEWRLFLGDADRPDQFRVADVAHMLKTPVDRVVVRRMEKGSSRALKVVHLAKSPDKSIDSVHPALRAEARAEGGEWAPGSRSILDALFIGGALGSGKPAGVKVYTRQQDARSVMVLGKSGSGKTNTATALGLSTIACGNAVLGMADIPKAGNLALPFTPALHRIATTPGELEADLQGLAALAKDRCERLARGEIRVDGKVARNWVPTKADPAVVYMIDELANTMIEVRGKDLEQEQRIWDLLISLGQFIRQAGIILLPISQTAKRDMIETDFTSQMGTFVVHQLKKLADGGDIWQGQDVDFLESGLPKVGMSLVGDVDGDEPVKAMACNMDDAIGDEKTWTTVIADYAAHRPNLRTHEVALLGWGNVLCGTQQPATPHPAAAAVQDGQAAAKATEAVYDDDAAGTLADALTGGQIPTGAPIISGDEPEQPGDPAKRKAVMDALLAAGDEGMARAKLDKMLGTSQSTTKRVLGQLVKAGKIRREGEGRASRYKLRDGVVAGV